MKSTLIGGRLALGFVSLFGLAQAFPTAENLAKLAHRDVQSPEQFHERLVQIKSKRIIDLNPLEEPIQSMCTFVSS